MFFIFEIIIVERSITGYQRSLTPRGRKAEYTCKTYHNGSRSVLSIQYLTSRYFRWFFFFKSIFGTNKRASIFTLVSRKRLNRWFICDTYLLTLLFILILSFLYSIINHQSGKSVCVQGCILWKSASLNTLRQFFTYTISYI